MNNVNIILFIKKQIKRLPFIKGFYKNIMKFPPGHYYSPIVNRQEMSKKNEFFKISRKRIKGININEKSQFKLLNLLSKYFKIYPYNNDENINFRYTIKNSTYGHGDSMYLFAMINYFKPNKIIEVGSGYSSALMIDTNVKYFENNIKLTFIDPHPQRLEKLLHINDMNFINLIPKKVQNVSLDPFLALNSGDFLFIDSSHVSKAGSDVNDIIFRILPRLNSGVIIHFHDVFFPFEYPKEWVLMKGGFGWNEGYLLKSFLMYNNQFEIILFNTFCERFNMDWFIDNHPDFPLNSGGNIWIRKL